MKNFSINQNYLYLSWIFLLGTILRFSHLDFKPFGIDEVITTIFGLGLSYDVIPQNIPINLTDLSEIFILNPITCNIIAENLINQSTHPPLFFCSLHQWLNIINDLPISLLSKVRSLPAIYGSISILFIYLLNRLAFSEKAGLMGALILAISPFHLYLSQEARHYTLPILIILISLIIFIKIYQNILAKKSDYLLWIAWALINTLALYIHYFSALALMAEYGTLLGIILQHKLRQIWLYVASGCLSMMLFLPWLSIILSHANNNKTNWLSPPQGLEPILQTLIAWILMIITLPMEGQTLIIQIVMGVITLFSVVVLLWYLIPKFKVVWHNYPATLPLVFFIGFVLVQFFVIIYLLKKDLTIAPRYHFLYYPAICALLGASLSINNTNQEVKKVNFFQKNRGLISITMISLFSCYCVLSNLAFEKPYRASFVLKEFNQAPPHLMIVMGYENATEMALGLGYALSLAKIRKQPEKTNLVLFDLGQRDRVFWEEIGKFSTTEDHLWIIGPGLLDHSFPETITREHGGKCDRLENQFYRIGFPFQGYTCSGIPQSS